MKNSYTSKKNFEKNKSVDRRFLWQYVCKKLNKSIHHAHVLNVINILLDEVLVELIDSKKIKIGNFGEFIFQKLNPRRHFNVFTKVFEVSKGNSIIRFVLNKKLKKFISNQIDVAKTFPETNDE
jgi:nucleoid DNA-binding protein